MPPAHGAIGALLAVGARSTVGAVTSFIPSLRKQAGGIVRSAVHKAPPAWRQNRCNLGGDAARRRARQRQTDHVHAGDRVDAGQNGYDIDVIGAAQLNRLPRARRLAVKQQASASVHRRAACTPTIVHQVDLSLCLVYYLRGKQFMIRDDEFYKNKPDRPRCKMLALHHDRPRLGAITVRYFERAPARTLRICFCSWMYASSSPGAAAWRNPRCCYGTRAAPTPRSPSICWGSLEVEGITTGFAMHARPGRSKTPTTWLKRSSSAASLRSGR